MEIWKKVLIHGMVLNGQKTDMRHMIFYLLFLSILFSCKEVRNKEKTASKDVAQQLQDTCSERRLRAKLLKAIIDIPELQQYIGPPEWMDCKQLALLRHSYFDDIDKESLLKFDKPIIILLEDETEKYLTEGYEDFLRFEEIHQRGDTIDVEFRYEREGLIGFTSFRKTDCDWHEIKTDLAEE